jgi:hypothetical protein
MSGRQRLVGSAVADRHKSHFAGGANDTESLNIREVRLGQSCPRHCPYPESQGCPLGTPMNIEEVAALLGCSAWTVRQRYLPQGLPYLRASANGRFVFFREQVIDWIVNRQERGGTK